MAVCRLKVLKESVNKGRFFYTCSKSVDERCSFFQWADEGEGQVNGRGWGGGDGGGGGGGDRGGGRGGRGGGRGRGVNKSSSSQFRAKPYESNAAPRQGFILFLFLVGLTLHTSISLNQFASNYFF